MKYLTNINRGSIIEEIMHNTSQYYRDNKIAYFRKTNPLYSPISKRNKNCANELFEEKSKELLIRFTYKGDLDYYGLYKGRYFSIELKETQKPEFSLTLITENQFSQLQEIDYLKGFALVLVHFMHAEKAFWLITYSQLMQFKFLKKSKKISILELEKMKAFSVEIIYPHILNLQPIFEKLLNLNH